MKTIIDHLWPKLQKQSEFAKDIEMICSLISDCIALNHPLVLEIRYLFCLHVNGGKCWDSRERWEQVIKGYDCSLPKFWEAIRRKRAFRKRIIQMLESEKLQLLPGEERENENGRL